MNTMTASEIASIMSAFASTVAAFTALAALLQSRSNSKGIEVVHKATNSMKDELVAEVRKSEHAEGKAEGKAEGSTKPC